MLLLFSNVLDIKHEPRHGPLFLRSRIDDPMFFNLCDNMIVVFTRRSSDSWQYLFYDDKVSISFRRDEGCPESHAFLTQKVKIKRAYSVIRSKQVSHFFLIMQFSLYKKVPFFHFKPF